VTWAVITILIVAPFVGTLWVPFYARSAPQVADFPFFYWYLLMWVPIVAITSAIAYALIRTTGRGHDGAGRPARAGSAGGTGGGGTGGGATGAEGQGTTGTGTE